MAKIQNKISSIKEKHTSPYYIQLFYDIGEGFKEDQSITKEIHGYEKNFYFDLSKIDNVIGLRFDPINIKCIFELSRLVLFKGEDSTPLNFSGNYFFRENTLLVFDTDDPNISIEFDFKNKENITGIGVAFEFLGLGNKAIDLFKLKNENLNQLKEELSELTTDQPVTQQGFFFESIREDYLDSISRLKNRNEILQKKFNSLVDDYTNKDLIRSKQNVQIDELQNKLNIFERNKVDLEKSISEKITSLDFIQKELQQMQLKKSDLEANHDSQKLKIEELESQHHELIQENKNLTAELKKQKEEINDLVTLKKIFERDNKRLEDSSKSNDKKLATLLDQLNILQKNIDERNLHIRNIEGFLIEKDDYLRKLESKKAELEIKLLETYQVANINEHHLNNMNLSMAALKESLSYKLGYNLTAPARWIYELTRKKKNDVVPTAALNAPEIEISNGLDEGQIIINEAINTQELSPDEPGIIEIPQQSSNELWTLENQIEMDSSFDKLPSKRYSVLFICPHLPDFDTSSGGKRATRMLELMAEEYDVYIYTLGDRPQKYINKMQEINVSVMKSPLYEDINIHTHDYQEVKDQVDHFDSIIFAWYTTYFQSKKILEFYPKANVIFDSVDVHWIREERLIGIDPGFSNEGVQINKRNEVLAYNSGNIVWAVTKDDVEHVLDEIPNSDCRVVSNIHEIEVDEYKDPGTNKILFLGGYKHTPNLSAVKVLVEEIFPIVKKKIPDAELILAGSHAPPEIQAYGEIDGINFKGFIDEEDLDALYEETFITVIPLLAGAGIKGKICEAISHMVPIATNDIGNEGIHLKNEVDGLIANDHEELAHLVINAMERKYDLKSFCEKAQIKLDAIVGPSKAKTEMINSITPPVSICIVTWNRLELLERCIESILKNTIYPNYKILVYSNGCKDGTKQYLKNISKEDSRIVPIISDKNEVFVIPNNKMMQRNNDDVVLVNNDTYVTKGWLSELQKTAYSRKDIGISGSKILYPNGKLQEFGSELYKNYSGNNIGKNDDPKKEKYQGEKEVGYVSGCSMYITRKTIQRIGVFDIQFHPCYCEDSDLAYTAWENGIASVVNSKSVIFHDEGGTSGTDTTNGFKAFQDLNFHKFYLKHRGKINRINWELDAIDLQTFHNAITHKFYSAEGRNLINGTQLNHSYSIKFQGNEINDYRSYKRYVFEMNAVYNKRFILERRIAELHSGSFNFTAFNPLINEMDEMIIGNERDIHLRGFNLPNYRDSLYSQRTKTTSRLRSLFLTIDLYLDHSKINNVYISDNVSNIYDYFLKQEKEIIYSLDEEFFNTRQKNNKYLSKKLSNIETDDNSIDLAIHNEMLHLSQDYKACLKEMYRVLKDDGIALLSVPFLLNNKKNSIRAIIDDEGDIEHIDSPVFYNNNLLCFQHFGWEFMEECKEIGFKDCIGSFSWSLYHGILGTDILTIVLKK